MKPSADALDDDFAPQKEHKRPNASANQDMPGGNKKAKIDSRPISSLPVDTSTAEKKHEIYSKYFKKYNKTMTQLEIEEIALSADRFVSEKPSTDLQQTIETLMPQWARQLKATTEDVYAAPVLLIITSSAIRAVELIRALPKISKLGKIGKLFAKHIKLEEQISFLQKTPIKVAVGTPARIRQLVESNHLGLDLLSLCIIDLAKDKKERTVFDIPEVATELFSLLHSHIKSAELSPLVGFY